MRCCAEGEAAGEAPSSCPRCDVVGHEVGRDTVGAMATLAVPAPLLVHRTYRYCATEACPVVYYGRGGVALGRQHVRVPVNAKDSGADVPLCYCFAHTRRSVAEKMDAREGPTSALIAREIEAGNCACELRNPTGRCCLGDVRRYEKELAHRPPGTDFARDRKPRSRGGP